MMSNGPWSWRRSVHRRLALDRGGLDLLDPVEHVHLAEALAAQAAHRPRGAGCAGGAARAAPNSRSGRAALRSAQIASGTSSTTATGSMWCALASATSGRRASGWTFVASTTVRRPASSRFAGDGVEHLEGGLGGGLVVLVVGHQATAGVRRHAPRSAGSAGPRSSTSPTRTRRRGRRGDSSGTVDRRHRAEHRHLRRRAALGVVRTDARAPTPHSRDGPRPGRPTRRTPPASTRSGGRRGAARPDGSVREAARCTRRWAWSATTVAGRA